MPRFHVFFGGCRALTPLPCQRCQLLVLIVVALAFCPFHADAATEVKPVRKRMEPELVIHGNAMSDIPAVVEVPMTKANPYSLLELNRHTLAGNILRPSDGHHNAAHWVVVFCPGWWEPCQAFSEPFMQIGAERQRTLNTALFTQEVRFAKVDCATEKVLCNEQGVEQYPTVHHYSGGGRVATWRGGRQGDVKSFTKWVNKQLHAVAKDAASAEGTSSDFRRMLISNFAPGERIWDVLIVTVVLALNIRLICRNPELGPKPRSRPRGDEKTQLPAQASQGVPAGRAGAAGATRFFPDAWSDRTSFEL